MYSPAGSEPRRYAPAIRWSLANLGPRFYIVGSDYLFPRAAGAIVRAQLDRWPAEIVGEDYVLLGSRNMRDVVQRIAAAKPDVVLNMLNGDSNIAFFEAMRSQGLTADTTPTMSFSVSEEELTNLPADAVTGHFASWTYFQSVAGGANERFVTRFRDRFGAERVTSDPIEAAYSGVRLFAQAVAMAGSDAPARVRARLKELSVSGPGGIVFVDGRNQHTWKTVRIGKVRADGQFDVVWTSGYPIAPQPFPALRAEAEWTSFLAELQADWGGRWENPGP